jgi:hypothetical protein
MVKLLFVARSNTIATGESKTRVYAPYSTPQTWYARIEFRFAMPYTTGFPFIQEKEVFDI